MEGRKLRVAVVGGGPAGAVLGQTLFRRCSKLHERTTHRCDGSGRAKLFCSPAAFAGASTADSLAQALTKQVEQIVKRSDSQKQHQQTVI